MRRGILRRRRKMDLVVRRADGVTGGNQLIKRRQIGQNGVQVVVAKDHLAVLAGVEVDFVRQGLNESFKFRNPNMKDECGCGESFTV